MKIKVFTVSHSLRNQQIWKLVSEFIIFSKRWKLKFNFRRWDLLIDLSRMNDSGNENINKFKKKDLHYNTNV